MKENLPLFVSSASVLYMSMLEHICIYMCIYIYIYILSAVLHSRHGQRFVIDCAQNSNALQMEERQSCICGTFHRSLAGCDRLKGSALSGLKPTRACGRASRRRCLPTMLQQRLQQQKQHQQQSRKHQQQQQHEAASAAAAVPPKRRPGAGGSAGIATRPHLLTSSLRVCVRVGVPAVGLLADQQQHRGPWRSAAATAAAQPASWAFCPNCSFARRRRPRGKPPGQASCCSAPWPLAPPTSATGSAPRSRRASQAQGQDWLAGLAPAVRVLVSASW